MSDNTLFLNTLINAFPDNAPDPFYSRLNDSMSVQVRYNVMVRRMQVFTVANQTVSFTPPNLALADWDIIIAKVIGTAKLNTTGKDTDGTTTIVGALDGYGTEIFPGYIILSTYNLSAMSVSGTAIVQLFYCKSEDDS